MSRNSLSTNPAAKRLQKDLAKFHADPAAHQMFHIEPDNVEDLFNLRGYIYGPPGTPYQGGVFHLEMGIPPQYPFQSPNVKFKTKVWHPNIDECGHVCLDTLSNRWTPSMSICTIMMSIQALLSSPNPDDGLNDIAAEQMVEFPNDYQKTVTFWTYHYAMNDADKTTDMVKANAPFEALVGQVMARTGKNYDEALSMLSYYNWKMEMVVAQHGKPDSVKDIGDDQMSPVNALSDDIFALLFGYFSLSELLACRLICRRWNSAVHEICSLRESAKLFISLEDVVSYGEEVLVHQVNTSSLSGDDQFEYWALKPSGRDDHFVVRKSNDSTSLTPEFCQFFARLFPNIKHLIIYLNDHHQYQPSLSTLLKYYSARLESLSLCGHVSSSRSQSSSHQQLLLFINSNLPQLKRLDLLMSNLPFLLFFNNGTLYSLAQILSQLRHFSINGKVSNSDHRSLPLDIAPVFELLGENCSSLALKNINFTASHLSDIYDALSSNPRLVTSVTHIKLTGDLSLAVIKFICTNFRYLTRLKLEFANTESTILCFQILIEICHLRNLVELHLCNLTYILALLPPHHLFIQSQRSIKPLNSLQTLTLINCKIPTGKCGQFFSELVVYFPNIANFTVKVPSKAENLNCKIIEEFLRRFFTKLKSINIVDLTDAGSTFAAMLCRNQQSVDEQMDTS